MSSADPDGAAVILPAEGPRGRGPLARISGATLAENIRIAVSAVPAGDPVVADLRADAWGHGAAIVAAELLAAGATALRVADEHAAGLLGAAGVPSLTTTVDPNVDPLTVFGLPGGAKGSTPALRLTGSVLSVKPLKAGEGVSYGYSHRAVADTRVALVTGGYAQGIVRALGNRATVVVAGTRHRIVGRVAMDVCVVDIGSTDVARGEDVVFFGDPASSDPSLQEWADATGMRVGELVAAVGQRALREHVA